ncbi:unnamed protein product [Rotaria magnacalcarata]|uniref:Uncharacterized protein n=2 Tax=Rotaria magnacalcarata TaxID=392030 RepID=A0A814NBQ1_9BILA|nr:unnamed protein product [Rotaria magnacalcarata]CAF2045014.1 unnamed protein product [Rotaria magnacalcarata]
MKHKFLKRSISNKQTQHRSYQTQTKRIPTPIDHVRSSSPDQIDLDIESVLSDLYSPCLKPTVQLKSQKLLKKDLLRFSNQRPSLLGPQTLQSHSIHQASQQIHSVTSSLSKSSSSSSSNDGRIASRRRSLSLTSRTFHATIHRIGPWADKSMNYFRSNQSDTSRPLQKLRTIKNLRISSPKSCISSNDNTYQFKIHPSKHTYIDEYRKSKGYLLNLPSSKQDTFLSLSSSTEIQDYDDDQISVVGTCRGGVGNSSLIERTYLSTTHMSSIAGTNSKFAGEIIDNLNRSPRISSTMNQVHIPSVMPTQNNSHFRWSRRSQFNSTRMLPPLTNQPLQYLSSIDPIGKLYARTKKTSTHNPAKLLFVNGRPKKRLPPLHKITLNLELPAGR